MTEFRAGFVALIGEPNAGKSTLVNTIIGEQVSIVNDKPQTTRKRALGILSTASSQIVFVDAPGIIHSDSGLNRFLQDEAKDVLAQADVILLLLAADDTEKKAKELIAMVETKRKPFKILITKADLLTGTVTPRFFSHLIEKKISFVSISAKTRPEEAKNEVINLLLPLLPRAERPLFDDEVYTTQTVREMSAEYIRSACFRHIHQEIPYGLAVKIMKFVENEGPVVKITAEILVDKESHKGIVIGSKGAMLKKIGSEARIEIEKLVDQKVFLELHVSVRPQWAKNAQMMRELGYVVAK